QPRRALLLGRGDGEEVAAAPPPGVDGAGDLVVRVEAEVPSRLAVGRIQDRVVDGNRLHGTLRWDRSAVYLRRWSTAIGRSELSVASSSRPCRVGHLVQRLGERIHRAR